MGHKANICSLDFHPYGEFVASGSQDTNIKVRPRVEPCISRQAGGGTRLYVLPGRVGFCLCVGLGVGVLPSL